MQKNNLNVTMYQEDIVKLRWEVKYHENYHVQIKVNTMLNCVFIKFRYS